MKTMLFFVAHFPNNRHHWPRKMRAGNMIIDLINSKTPSTAMPNKRNGNRINHTRGYTISANKAKGQHTTKSTTHNKNAITGLLL
jgi:hypothetical protein